MGSCGGKTACLVVCGEFDSRHRRQCYADIVKLVSRELAMFALRVRTPLSAPVDVRRMWPRGKAAGFHPVYAGSNPVVRSKVKRVLVLRTST